MRFLVLLLACVSLFAGQSIRLDAWAGIFVPSATCSNISDSSDWRLEFRVHNAAAPASNVSVFFIDCLDMYIQVQTSGLLYVVEQVSGANFTASGSARSEMLVRVQRNISAGRVDVEVWDVDGGNYQATATTGLTFSGSYATANAGFNAWSHSGDYTRLAFMRAFTSLVPLGSRPPTTADVGDYFDWKFDGNGADSSGNGRTVNVSGAQFSTTPAVAAVAVAKTANTPAWAPFRPLRAGHPGQLDATASYSMADAGDEVTCFWQQVPHASGEPLTSQVIFDNRNSCTPTVTGLVFGPYRFRLQVTDADGAKATADLDAGAVAYDANGVVIYPDERLYTLLGPSKVFGSNPWEWADERLWKMLSANWQQYEINGGTWLPESLKSTLNGTPRSGTAYVANGASTVYGVGTNFLDVFTGGRAGTARAGSEWLSIAIEIGGTRYQRPIASCSSQTQCTFADGTVWQATTIPSPGAAWGTFGYGNLVYGAGTIYSNISQPTKLFGVGTDFVNQLCDGGGTPQGATYLRIYESTTVQQVQVTACNSATEITLSANYSGPAINSPGAKYQFTDDDLWTGNWAPNLSTTINYYDVAAGMYRLYYMSGSVKARDAARWLADNWFWVNGVTVYRRSQAWLGMALRRVVDGGTDAEDFWSALDGDLIFAMDTAQFRAIGVSQDLREDAYVLEAIALAAMYDPDSARRARQLQRLKETYDELWGPDIEPGGWYENLQANGDSGRVVTVSTGSATVTKHSGADFGADYCGDPASFYSTGTLGLTSGSTAITVTGGSLASHINKTIFIRGTLGGQPYSQVNRVGSATSLYWPWPGDTGTAVAWRAQAYYSPLGFVDLAALEFMPVNSSGSPLGKTSSDGLKSRTERSNWYWCTRDSGTQLTLDKPYTGDTSSSVYRRIFGGGQYPAQPFIHAIVARALFLAGDAAVANSEATYATNYRARGAAVVEWLLAKGTTHFDRGFPYFAEAAFCVPESVQPNACTGSDDLRSYLIDTNEALARWYQLNSSPANKTAIDSWYTAQVAKSGFASPQPGDGQVAAVLNDGEWDFQAPYGNNFSKAPGQFAGVGGSPMWPAAREGGPAAAQNRTLTVQVGSPLAYGDRIRITATNASGVAVTNTCQAVTCSVTSDFRAGGQSVLVEYLNASSVVLARATQNLIVN